MKKLGLSILFAAISISRSWAGDEPPTIESNKNLIDLVQTHADYVWTLVAAALVFLWVFPAAFLMFKLIEKTVGLRVSAEEEMEGLDLAEHGGNAYPDFEVSSYGGVGSAIGPGSPSATCDAVGQFKPVQQT